MSHVSKEYERREVLTEEKKREISRRLNELEDKKRNDSYTRSEFETLKKMVTDLQDQLTGAMASKIRGADSTETAHERRKSDDPHPKGPQRTSGRDQSGCEEMDLPSSSGHKSARMTIGTFGQHKSFTSFTIILKMILFGQRL